MLVNGTKALLFLFVLISVSRCALFGGGNETLIRADHYSVNAPSSWKMVNEGESDEAYQLPNKNIVTVTSSCKKNPNTPLEVLTRQLLMGSRKIQYVKREKIKVANEEALFSLVKAMNENRSVTMALVVLTSHECIFDFSLLSNKEIADSEIQEFLNFVKTFRYGKH